MGRGGSTLSFGTNSIKTRLLYAEFSFKCLGKTSKEKKNYFRDIVPNGGGSLGQSKLVPNSPTNATKQNKQYSKQGFSKPKTSLYNVKPPYILFSCLTSEEKGQFSCPPGHNLRVK